MSKVYMFDDVSTKEDLYKKIIDNSWVLETAFFDSERVGRLVNSIQTLNVNEEKEILEFVHYIDQNMNYSDNEDDYGRSLKIPAIITGIDYIKNYHERKEELSMASFALLSGIPFNDIENGYQEITEMYPKEVLDCISSRNISFDMQLNMAYLVEKLHKEGKSDTEIVEYIDSRENDELYNEGYDYINSWMEDVMFNSKKK